MWEQIVVALVMMVVSAAIQVAMAPETSTPDREAGSMDVPTAEEGGTIKVVFGTVIIKDPNVIWYGDPKITEIKSSGGGKK